MDQWMWVESKKLEIYLQLYDTGQQEARLHWLLLREFGHHETYPFSKGMWEESTWQGTCIMGQQGVWIHYDDVIIMFSPHGLHDGGLLGQQRHFFLWRIGREQGQIFSHTWHDAVGGGDGTILVQGGYSLSLDDLEVLPPWKELLVCNNIMGKFFDMRHVK